MPTRDPHGSLGPLVVSTGSGPTIQGVRARPDSVSELARWFDVVFVESRGIGDRGSAATVRCSVPQPDPRRLQITPGAAAWRAYARDNAAYDRSCRIAAGPTYAGLTSWQVAHDLDAVRAALGQPRLRYFGNGYGAVYGQAYLELFPRRVERMYLEGVPDHGQSSVGRRLIAHARAAERQLAAFRAWCARRMGCPLGGEDAVEVLDGLLERAPLPAGYGHTAYDRTVDGREAGGREAGGHAVGGREVDGREAGGYAVDGREVGGREAGGYAVGGREAGAREMDGRTVDAREVVVAVLAGLVPQRWPELARALAAAEAGDASALAAMAAPAPPVAPALVDRSLHCHDFMPAVPGYRRFLAMEARLRAIAPRVGWLTGRYEVGRCLGIDGHPSWPPRPAALAPKPHRDAAASARVSEDAATQARAGEDAAVRGRTRGHGAATQRGRKAPVVLVGIGRLDTESPASAAAQVAERIQGAVVLWHGDGHGAYLLQGTAKLRATCLRARVHDFLVNGTPPRTRCPGELTAAMDS
uniref:Proteinase (Secreted protein) n=2 Tax=Nonomuraea gerenzanensis TaxID=93944 RepID=A0A1M4E7B2_9ACTN|nr:proteinase (secreted protein) [Nonomuraea gerenzanensis]